MNRWVLIGLMVSGSFLWTSGVLSHEEHASHAPEREKDAEAVSTETVLKGEVVDVFCYLSHGKEGLGRGHASCAKKCIQSGLPVAVKVGDQLYLATMADHEPANKTLAAFAGESVEVRGRLMEQDGQHLIAITNVERAP